MKRVILTMCVVLCVLAIFTSTVQAGLAPPSQITIEMPMPRELSVVEQSLDDLACRGRLLRAVGRAVSSPFRHHRR